MTRRRWIADEFAGDRAALTGANAEHLARVLRARIGQEFDVSAGGHVCRGRIVSISQQRVDFVLLEETETVEPLPTQLILAIFKFDRFEWAVEKATELGVARIVPVVTHRTEKHLAAAARRRVERWRKIAHEAAQQSRRSSPPEISDPVKLKAVLDGSGTRIVLAESETAKTLRQALAQAKRPIVLAVGPEGGWNEQELAFFRESGWIAASLGRTILRAETAAVAALAIAAAELR